MALIVKPLKCSDILGRISLILAHRISDSGPITQSDPGLDKTSGFTRPVTGRTRENPNGRFLWGIFRFFSRKSFSQYPNTQHMWLGIDSNAKIFQLNSRKCLWDSSEGVSFLKKKTNTENSSGPHMQEIISLADPSPGLFVIAREMRRGRWVRGSGLECNV